VNVVRINEFCVLKDRRDEFLIALRSVLPLIRRADGCLSCQLLESESDPQHLVILEVWTTHDAHKAAAQAIPSDLLRRTMPMLSDVPSGTYFSEVS